MVGSSVSAPCTFFRIYYKHSEYEVFQTDTLREGLLKLLNNDGAQLRARALLSDEKLLDYMFRLGAEQLRAEAGWGLVAVLIGTTLTETPYDRYGD